MTAGRTGARAGARSLTTPMATTGTTTTSTSSSTSRTTSPATTTGTTGTTGTTTTDRLAGLGTSVRARIIATVAALLALALAGAGAVVYAIASRDIEQAARAEVDQELAEFGAFLRPEGQQAPALPPGLEGKLKAFLGRNVPDDSEVLIGWLGGEPRLVSPGAAVPDAEDSLLPDADFLAAARRAIDGGSTTINSTEHGELVVAAQPVDQDGVTGALVVVSHLDLEKQDLRDTMRTYALVAFGSLVLITVLAAWQSGRLLAPLRVLRETTDEINETDLALRLPEVGNDDITALTRTLNGMLARLESAFVGQRQFLDDAGHELKTPLTVLQGHLELLDPDDPGEVAETRQLLLDEIDRMSRLVGDLILLAKSDRPDFLTVAPVSLERLTHTLLSKARGLADRDWVLDGAGEAVVPLDEQRVTQAVLQLADNAVKHTDTGDEVAIGSAAHGSSVRIWVRDTGPGVPESDRQHVFERFGRSVVRPGDEGFGLGLSIVRAIATAHHGRVEVDPDHSPGARFVIVLPTESEAPWPAS